MAAAGVGWTANAPDGRRRRLETVKLCLELGNGINAADAFSYTALHGAAYRGDNELVKFLVEKGARLNADHLRHQRHRHGQRLCCLQQPAAGAPRNCPAAAETRCSDTFTRLGKEKARIRNAKALN